MRFYYKKSSRLFESIPETLSHTFSLSLRADPGEGGTQAGGQIQFACIKKDFFSEKYSG